MYENDRTMCQYNRYDSHTVTETNEPVPVESGEALKENRRMLASLMSNLPGMAYRCKNDPDWTMEFVSDGCFELTGYTAREITGSTRLTYNQIIHPEDRETVRNAVEKGITAHDQFRVSYRIVTSAGKNKWVWEQGRGLYDRDGNITILEGLIIDITEQKEAEEKLARSRRKYRALFDQSNDAIIIHFPDGKIIDANHRASEMLGYDRTQLKKMSFNEFEQKPSDGGYDSAMKTLTEKGYLHLETQLRKSDDKIFDVNISARIIDRETGAIQSILRDITKNKSAEKALKESKEYLRQTIEQSPLGIMTISPYGSVVYINAAYLKMLGGSLTREDIIGKQNIKSFEHFVKAGLSTAIDSMLKKGVSLDESGWIENKGRRFYAHHRASPLRHMDGTISGFIWAVSDETESRLAEENRLRFESQLRQGKKMEAIGTLAGGIANDFNNILNAIIGYTEMAIQDAGTDSTASQSLSHVLTAGARAKDLVRQILAFSRQVKPDPKPVQISKAIHEGLRLLRTSTPENVEISEDIDDASGVVMADVPQIQEVLMNLFSNSCDAMRESGGILDISLHPYDIKSDTEAKALNLKKGGYVRLTVTDTGEGMDNVTMERIFDPFFTTKPSGDGSGLGLSMVHGIIMGHGGTITVDSEPGKGTSFSIFLPRSTEQEKKAIAKINSLPVGDERILVVDDEEILVTLQAEMLKRLGYKVETRTSSIEAYELFKVRPDGFDLIITDQIMPNMTGTEFVRKILELRPDMPVILSTGFSENVSQENSSELGIAEFIMKPVVMSDLANIVRRTLNASRHKTILART